jgi:hypothetical protein
MKRLVPFLIVAAALLAPSAAFASGVVLKVQHASQLVAVTRAGAKVALVHTSATGRLHVGQRIAVTSRTLRNGTLAASSVRILGRAHSVHFRGLLLSKSRTRLVVSAGGAVISVNRGGRTTSSASDSGPAPGTTVEVTATVGTGDELDEDSVTTVSADHPGGAIEGKLTIGTGKITVTSEHMALAINVPAGFDLSKFAAGDEVLATFAQQADGTLLLTALSGDANAQEADGSNGDDNGDDGGDDHGGDSHGGDSHGGGAPAGGTVSING